MLDHGFKELGPVSPVHGKCGEWVIAWEDIASPKGSLWQISQLVWLFMHSLYTMTSKLSVFSLSLQDI